MDRREVLRTTGWIAGTGLLVPGVLAALQSCKNNEKRIDWSPHVLSDDQALHLTLLSDTIVPATETPSASEVHVPEFVDLIMTDVLSKDQSQLISEGMDKLNEISRDQTGKEFSGIIDSDRYKLIKTIDEAAFTIKKATDFDESFLTSYRYLKSLILIAYFTSEEGVKQNLNYVVIPEKYEGCIDLPADRKVMVGNHM